MSWYKKASISFIDTVGVASYGDSHATIIIGTKQFYYSGVDGYAINNKITRFRSMKNKQNAGKLCSQFLQQIKPYLQSNPEQKPEESLQHLIDRSEETLF